MNLPKNNYDLDRMFKNSKPPDISILNGEYFVDMLTVLPSLRKFFHRKFFYFNKDRILGYNILFSKMVWGRFFVQEGICKEMDSLKVAVIDYCVKENSFISNKIRDYVRCIDENQLYLGRFNYYLMGELRFLGYFSLTKA